MTFLDGFESRSVRDLGPFFVALAGESTLTRIGEEFITQESPSRTGYHQP